MRELKFRSWDKHRKVMADPFTLLQCPSTVSGKPIGIQLAVDQVFMQFTGLYDKHGVPIYEGDIVTLSATSDIKGATGRYTAEVLWDEEDTGFFYATTTDKYPHIKPWHAKDVEVAGNIYRYPHLLEPT